MGHTVKVAKVDATQEQSLGSRFGVQGFPTIKLFPSGKKTQSNVVDYNEGRDLGSLTNFATKYFSMTLEACSKQISKFHGFCLCYLVIFS